MASARAEEEAPWVWALTATWGGPWDLWAEAHPPAWAVAARVDHSCPGPSWAEGGLEVEVVRVLQAAGEGCWVQVEGVPWDLEADPWVRMALGRWDQWVRTAGPWDRWDQWVTEWDLAGRWVIAWDLADRWVPAGRWVTVWDLVDRWVLDRGVLRCWGLGEDRWGREEAGLEALGREGDNFCWRYY